MKLFLVDRILYQKQSSTPILDGLFYMPLSFATSFPGPLVFDNYPMERKGK